MKFSITLTFIMLSFFSFGQDLTEIKSSLEKLKIDENGSYESDKWYYNPEIADIIEIKKEILNQVLAEYDLYSTVLEGFYGWHKKTSRCLILRKSDNGELIVIDPIWYSGISTEFLKMIIGYKFKSEKELQLFTFELQDVMLIGSTHNKDFKNTVFSENKITIDLYDSYKEERVWRKIEIGINKNTIEFLTSTNPITKEKLTVKK
ncbi:MULTISPECIES: hypothetical protein [unclassified Polaribacter]|uniref:hypothetical protein n=1 Tax=unclassified Polaribacter TaxID=196858 RepID=UPI0011BE8783|nr:MULTISPECIES: hypothetical protein [unclassified Polaribacter]TXD50462.1 hypothetical protein ES043_15850 [Polaribacter sp. IC063]TXD56884.1 hypothetical protein ES044_16130 [Polaribacter sp. IC066]